jgi:2-dehydro-3-deoxyphosphogluconate aldolase/(4S)-4-hydroxy-2-oxoglutarate aldolase
LNREQIRARIREIGIIPAVRLYSAEDALFAAEAVCAAGVPVVEVTMTVPGAAKVIYELARQNSEIIVGAGTVLDVETAHRCLDAGASFITSTGFDPEIVNFVFKRSVVVFPGACTPTEALAAWKAGSDFVKIFPCSAMGGAGYIRALKGPFPQIPMIASGGADGDRFHSRGRGGGWYRQRLDSPGCDQTPGRRLDPRTRAAVLADGRRSAQSDKAKCHIDSWSSF